MLLLFPGVVLGTNTVHEGPCVCSSLSADHEPKIQRLRILPLGVKDP